MKHGFKKTISAVLSAVLLAVSLVVPLSAEEAAPKNRLVNGGFEDDFTPSRIFNNAGAETAQSVMQENAGKWGQVNSTVTPMERVLSESYSENDSIARNGNAYLKTGATADGAYIRGLGQFVYLEPGDYILVYDAKNLAEKNGNDKLYAGIYTSGITMPAYGQTVVIQQSIPVSNNWQNYSYEFKISTAQYYQVGFGGNSTDGTNKPFNAELYLDNVAVYEKAAVKTVSVEASGNNTATASSTLGLPGTVLTATAQGGSAFVGWYVNGQQVSAESEYTLPAALTENTAFLAKFTGNLIKDGDFEALPTGSLDIRYDANGNPKLKNFCWGRVATGVSNGKVVQAEGAGHTGNGYLEYALSGQFVRTVGTLVPVEQNKQYQLTFWAKSNAADYAISTMILKTNATNGNSDQQIATNARIAINKETAEWQQYSLSFNSGSYTQVAVAFGGNGTGTTGTYAIDDVVLNQVVTVEAQAQTLGAAGKVVGGTVTGGGTYAEGQQVTLTAKANSGFTFAGWSNGAQTETVTVSAADQTLVASFKNNSKNLIVNGDFENEAYTVSAVFETVGQKALFQKAASPTGTGYALKAEANKATGLAVNNIAVLAGHSYAFSCKLYLETEASHAQANNFERIGFWKNGVTEFNTANFPFENKSAYKPFINKTTDKATAVTGEWVEYTVILKPEENATLAVGIGSVNATCNVDWYIDDIALYDLTESAVSTGVDSSTGALNENGFSAAIRAADSTDGNVAKNGLRLYNAVEKGLLGSVKEYGTIVVRKAYLEKANAANWKGTDLADKGPFSEPVVEMHGIGGIGFGVAYRKAGAATQTGTGAVVPILWRDDFKNSNMYTAYATGIQEEFYGDAYLFRTYAVLENNAVVYGETVEVSVFDVANAISNAENAPANDVAAFNAFVNENTKEAYAAWCETNQKATGKLFK